jgi:hypothetical protein
LLILVWRKLEVTNRVSFIFYVKTEHGIIYVFAIMAEIGVGTISAAINLKTTDLVSAGIAIY